jgi:hypothetical protein
MREILLRFPLHPDPTTCSFFLTTETGQTSSFFLKEKAALNAVDNRLRSENALLSDRADQVLH